MLNLGEAADQTFATASTWKVLVYDKFCQAILRPQKVATVNSGSQTLN